MKTLDLITTPLKGANLIEASAGTGKTYTITRLFLRLIVEKKLSGSEILVVTFTEAATEELRDRIRTTLKDAIQTLVSGTSKDEILPQLLYHERAGTEQEVLERLRTAVRTFDETSIFTIHSFCQRMLSEKAFESGTLFDTELITDQRLLIQEIIDDFWRNNFYNTSSLFIDYALDNKYSPHIFAQLIPSGSYFHDFSVIPCNLNPVNSDSLENEFSETFHNASAAWLAITIKDEIKEILLNAPINRNKYRGLDKNISSWMSKLDKIFSLQRGKPHALVNSKEFEKFTASKLAGSMTKGNKPPEHTFFTLCQKLKDQSESLCTAFEHNLLALKRDFLMYLTRELTQRKAEKNIQYFDDLLINLRNALNDKDKGRGLAQAIRKKYRAALIDEFQDTDPLQWDIFRHIFTSPDSALFLIGDPKQAIYAFRGADIFTYMQASEAVRSQYTLKINYRSSSRLITAVNTIFSQSNRSFIFDSISFKPIEACKTSDSIPLTIKGKMEPPFQLWFVSREQEKATEKPLATTRALGLIARAVAQEVAKLLYLSHKGEVMIGTRALRSADIAVLVREHKQAHLIRSELMLLKIPCVVDSTENLFDTPEAAQVERILSAVAEPHKGELIKAALASDIMGLSGEEIEEAVNDEQKWDVLTIEFRSLNELWHRHSFMMMFRNFLTRYKVRQRLLGFLDGERRLTNILHIAEVLQRISSENKLGIAALIQWLSEQRYPDTPRLKEYQIRLESDEDAVRLVTIHKSKGLEYPVVFVPFVWQKSRCKNKDLLPFHDEEKKLTLALGNDEIEKHRALAERELLAENMRLLYVALTRAKNRCYLLWGSFNQAETSAAAYLFHHKSNPDDFLTKDYNKILKMTDNDILSDLKQIEELSQGALQLSLMDTEPHYSYLVFEPQEKHLRCYNFTGTMRKDWTISSFSGIIREKTDNEELPDHDALVTEFAVPVETPIQGVELSTIFDFPKGARPGTCLHEIFEDLDFTASDPSPIVEKKLQKFNFETKWIDVVSTMVKNVLTTPLSTDSPHLTLNRLTHKDRINEMEFYFPLSLLSKNKLSRVFQKYGHADLSLFPQEIEKLQFSPMRGFMKGFIDMVFTFQNKFYLVDWKSNYLGNQTLHYGQVELTRIMHEDYYILQYLIYTVALNQYLTQRVPLYDYNTHFGGAFYIFLRGVDSDFGPKYGIYQDRPAKKLVEELSDVLMR
jgi:exodeoxyribonuclease V beta subunit